MLSFRLAKVVLLWCCVLFVPEIPAWGQCELHEDAKLIASNGAAGDSFGYSLAISGNVVVVGAPYRDCALGTNCGSAYVFRLNGANWVEEAELIPSGLAPFDRFGRAVAVDGERIVVGAVHYEPNGPSNVGAGYVFRFDGTAWVQEAKLTAPDAAQSRYFGTSVAVRGDRVFVGGYGSGFGDVGALYIFRRQGAAWMQEAKLLSLYSEDSFGHAVSVHGDRALVGAPNGGCESNVASPPGSAYMFRREGTNWLQEGQLPCPPGCCSQSLGAAVSLSDSVAIVAHEFNNQSAASVYRRSDTMWSREAILGPLVGNTPFLSVATDGDAAVVGIMYADAAHVFNYDGSNWPEVAQLTSTDIAPGDYFGSAVSMSANRVLIGAFGDDNANGIDAGAVYAFARARDCNRNGVGDACDIASETSLDLDGNGVPDECPPTPVIDPSVTDQCRFISFSVPGFAAATLEGRAAPSYLSTKSRSVADQPLSPLKKEGGVAAVGETALRVNLTSLHQVDPPYTGDASVPFTAFEGQVRWVGPPTLYVESDSNPIPFYASFLQCTPEYRDWSTVGLLHVTGSAIVPSSIYGVENVAAVCAGNESTCAVSALLQITTTRWGDVVHPFNPPDGSAQPDFGDIGALVDKFKNASGAPIKARAKLQPDVPDLTADVDFSDIADGVDAFKGLPYPYTIAECP